MPNTPNRLAVERVHWLEVFPVLRLGSAFRYALQPGKLIVALLAVMLLHGSGLLMDALWGVEIPLTLFDYEGETAGIYEAFLIDQTRAVEAFADSARGVQVTPYFGEGGIIQSIATFFVHNPIAYAKRFPSFAGVYGLIAFVVLSLSSGAICRMSATQVCSGKLTGMVRAVKFVGRRWLWYLLSPALPMLLVAVLSIVLVLAGLIFFNLPFLDVIGSVLYGVLLLLGFVIALIGFVLLFGVFLMPPAMSVEGTDAFDAIARAYNYVMYKPWQLAGYLLASVVYLAAVYLVVTALYGLTLQATQGIVSLGSFSEVGPANRTHFEEITNKGRGDDVSTIPASAWLVARWVELLGGLAIALMYSLICSMMTQVYVLMRRCADGAPIDECADDDEKDLWSSPEDMVDPAAQAFAASGPKGHPRPDHEPASATDDPPTEDTGQEQADDKPEG